VRLASINNMKNTSRSGKLFFGLKVSILSIENLFHNLLLLLI
jgi:hypothetical protein